MKIALVVNLVYDFYNFCIRYALFLKRKGFEVTAIVPNDGYADKIRIHGITTITIDIDIRESSFKTIRAYYKGLKEIFKK